MPMRVKKHDTGGEVHPNPFVGPINHTAPVSVDVSKLTSKEVDKYGYIRPGVMFTRTGLLPGASSVAYGALVEATKVADGNAAGQLTAAGTQKVIVAVICTMNRKILEDSLGRVLTADEIAAAQAGNIVLIY